MLKVVQKKLEVTKRKVSKEWGKYRREKSKILHRKSLTLFEKQGLLSEIRGDTRERVSEKFKDYRIVKHGLLYRSDIEDFKYVRGYKTGGHILDTGELSPGTVQKFYKTGPKYNTDKLDSIVPALLKKDKVKGVMVMQEVYNKELGAKTMVSKYITTKNLKKAKGNIYQYMNDSIFTLMKYSGYKMKNIQLRVIYSK